MKIIISVSLVGFALVVISVIQSPNAKVIFASFISLAQYLITNSDKIIIPRVLWINRFIDFGCRIALPYLLSKRQKDAKQDNNDVKILKEGCRSTN
ncbi:MAG: hypothetical protein U0V48_18260 [Anaerolineales bacterium]